MSEVILETRSLTKLYDDFIAVDQLSFNVKCGEVFGLLGPNGAGKTTTILMLLGLTEPTFGSAEIAGLDCSRNTLQIKHVVGYLSDNMGFYPDMTGRENLRMTGRMNGLSGTRLESRINHLVHRVGIGKAADKKTGTYSKGMKQRLGIADILMKDPDILIMDEPTNGIDPEGMRDLMKLIRELSELDGKTILISSHQLHQIRQICDRVGIFVDGKLVACGTIDELGQQLELEEGFQWEICLFGNPYKALKPIKRIKTVTKAMCQDGILYVKATEDIGTDLLQAVLENDCTIKSFQKTSGDLDHIYTRYFKKAGENDAVNIDKRKRLFSRPHKPN